MNADERAAFLEDVTWMAETGETVPGACVRLDRTMRPAQLQSRLASAGRSDLWARLVANATPGYTGPHGSIVHAEFRRAA